LAKARPKRLLPMVTNYESVGSRPKARGTYRGQERKFRNQTAKWNHWKDTNVRESPAIKVIIVTP